MTKKIFAFALMLMTVLSACGNGGDESAAQAQTAAETESSQLQTSENAIEEVTKLSYEIDTSKPLVALTFDDGPNITTTVQVLDILEKYQVPASFFVIGQNINESTEKVIKQCYDMGCEIDNHSATHSNMTQMEPEEIISEVKSVSDKVEEITGEKTKFFRPPYIAVNSVMYDNIDMPFICGAGCNDWDAAVTVDQRVEKTLEQVQDGTIILLHDAAGNSQTVDAIDIIIPKLLDEDYQFVTVSQLFQAKGIEISPDDTNLYTYVQ